MTSKPAPPPSEVKPCEHCGRPIIFVTTVNDRSWPLDALYRAGGGDEMLAIPRSDNRYHLAKLEKGQFGQRPHHWTCENVPGQRKGRRYWQKRIRRMSEPTLFDR